MHMRHQVIFSKWCFDVYQKNHRPVSSTCICCKLLEHIVVSNMLKHLDQHNILVDCQHGFRSKHSCETQLLTLSHELLNNLYTDKQTDLIILDFYKAFDKVPHKKLLRKLDNYSIRRKHWISAFLKNRQQRVVLDGEVSNQMPELFELFWPYRWS